MMDEKEHLRPTLNEFEKDKIKTLNTFFYEEYFSWIDFCIPFIRDYGWSITVYDYCNRHGFISKDYDYFYGCNLCFNE